MNEKGKLVNTAELAHMRIMATVLVVSALLVQGIFFYCVVFQYNTYGTPSAYEYYIDYDEWIDMIEMEQIQEHNWFLDNTLGINSAAVLAMLILFAVMVSYAKQYQIPLSRVKQTAIGTGIVYMVLISLIRFTADMFRLYMDFTEAETISSALLIFILLNRKNIKKLIG